MSESEAPVPSPCTGLCKVNDEDICIGCFRSLDEIVQWGSQTNVWRKQVIEKSKQRQSYNDKS